MKPNGYATAYHERKRSIARQKKLLAAGQCINGNHGPVLIGVRCPECVAMHMRHDLLQTGRRVQLRALRMARELEQIARIKPLNNEQRTA